MADIRIKDLPELTFPADEDLLIVEDDPNGTPITKRVSFVNIRAELQGAKGDTGTAGVSIKGDTGVSVKGDTGTAGSKGDTGTAGSKGDTGVGAVLVAAPADDHSANGITITLNANEAHNFGDVCYINTDGQAQLIDADAIATMSGLFMATASISANADGTYLVLGIARDDTWAWTVGGLIYGTVTGTTGNTLSQTAPTGTDDVVQILGVATHADRILFNPSLVQIELV